MSSLTGPPPATVGPVRRLREDWRAERTVATPYPPGLTRFSARRTRSFERDPLAILLDAYGRFGPVFTLRVFHQNVVFVLGPEANHHLLVSHAENFSWRDGHMSDLLPFLGDGLLTVDGPFHRASRKAMLPAFAKEQIAASRELMRDETQTAVASLEPGTVLDVYAWTRELALRIAMRALFGLDPDAPRRSGIDASVEFERALSFYARPFAVQVLRGPGTPWRRMHAARERLDSVIFAEVRRRRRGEHPGDDLLGLLCAASDEEGRGLSEQHVRDEVMTLLFAGHDTTTSAVAFLLHLLAEDADAQDRVAADLAAGSTAQLDLAVDETLRLFPPAWVGPRKAVRETTIAGVRVPAGVPVNYSSWASHRLPDVWENPERFDPQRFAPGRRETIPKGAYVPFGGGSRTCVGMRFGQAEIAVIARTLLERFAFAPPPGCENASLRVRQMPTLSPVGGMPLAVSRR